MSVTINAHQLGRLIDKTISHMGSEYVEPLHGIRLDVDAKYVYAVASDRYTIAVARYELNHGDQQQEPWARTIPAEHLRSIREWIDTMKGAGLITISTAKDRLVFEGPQTDLSIAVSTSLEFPDWRGLLRKQVEQAVEGTTFPALNSGFLARFNNGDVIRTRLTGDERPLLVFAEDFIGAQMPTRHAGIYPCKEESFEGVHKAWLWTLAAGSKDADMSGAAYEEDRPRYEVTTDIRETGEMLLQQTLQSGWDMRGKSEEKPDEFLAHCLASVNGWMAFRYLDALYNVDPRAAAEVVAETAGELDSGEIGEFAWDAARKAGFKPDKWHDDYEAHLKKLAEERAAKAETTA
ncbi:MAG: hypothetical protein HOY79_01010 [Streptomyces sp.]|nr:hypothetical protein [Streptomyces sp.]